MLRHQLTDDQWVCIEDLFPPPKRTGRPARDRRVVLGGIFWILRTGSQWRDLPDDFGPWETVYRLFNTWNDSGLLDQILNRLQGTYIETGELDQELWCIDGTVIRAARCAAGGGKKKIRKNRLITH